MKLTLTLLAALLLAPAALPKTPKPKAPKPPKTASHSEKTEFRRSHPCPSNGRTSGACPGYVVAYIKSPKQGGTHSAMNMQWVTAVEGKTRTRVK